MKAKLILLSLILIACDKKNDPAPIQSSFPAPDLLKTWQAVNTIVSNCGNSNGNTSWTSTQKLVLTSVKTTRGNYQATYQGSPLEYQLKGDSIILWIAPTNPPGFYGYQKGVYSFQNSGDLLTIKGKYTVINQLTGCDFEDHYQKYT